MKKVFLFIAAALMSAMTWATDGTYKLCTSTDDLVAGEHYIIANGTDGDVYCMATTSNTNNRKRASATVSESAIEVSEGSGILTLTLGGESGAWTFYTDNYEGSNGYLASASSGNNNHCRVIADLTTATISFTEEGAVINLQPHASRTLLRYNTQGMFACYASGQNPVYLYKKDSAAPTATLDSIVIKGMATKMEYKVGEAFDPAGLEVWGIYTKTVKGDSTSQIKSGITWSFNPEVFALGNTSVAVTATYKDFTSEVFTVNDIVVTEKPAPVGVAYTKVTAAPDNWAGEYVVVYEVEGTARVFTGVDLVSNFVEAEIIDNTVVGDFNTIILEATEGGFVVKINGGENNGKYITFKDGASNGLTFGDEGVVMTVSYDTESASTLIVNEGGAALRYNNASNQNRFRMYKNIGQQPIQLYKKSAVGPGTGIREAMVNANVRKAMVNGRLIIVKGEKAFDLQGRIVK